MSAQVSRRRRDTQARAVAAGRFLPLLARRDNVSSVDLTPREAAERAREALQKPRVHVAIVGKPGSGRSLALDLLADSLVAAEGGHPVRVALGPSDDAAFVTLVDVARQVESAALLDLVRDPGTRFSTKVGEVVRTLSESKRPVLFEDPRFGTHASDLFGEAAAKVTRAFHQGLDRVVYAASLGDPIESRIRVRPGSSADEVLARDWPSDDLTTAARSLVACAADLSAYSPLELRLAVACVAVGVSPKDVSRRAWSIRELVACSLGHERFLGLRALLGALSLVRVPFRLVDVARLTGGSPSPAELDVLRACMLIERRDTFSVHQVIADQAVEWVDDRAKAHERIAEWHRGEFDGRTSATDLGMASRHEMECVHHLTEAGDTDGISRVRVFFSEQYDVLGKALSLAKRHDEAVRAYERALAFDPEDAYAHHYLAYNLDVQGVDARRVIEEYEVARALCAEHVWYHSRLITALVTIGRMKEAESAWAEAVRTLPEDAQTYDELHRNVAKLLVHRGELVFVRRVLEAIPRSVRHELEWYEGLEQRLVQLEEAKRDECVFPPVVRLKDRWDGPHLLRSQDDAEKVASWAPGRITGTDDDGAIRILTCRKDGEALEFFYRDFSADEVREASPAVRQGLTLPEGTFVETLVYTDGTERLLTWPRQSGELRDLKVEPPPDRYIRRALAAPRSR